MTALDAIGPHEILSRIPGASVFRVARQKGPIRTDSELLLTADHSLTDVRKADLLLIPGGGNATTLSDHPDILEWVRSIHATTTWTTSVCTGSLILGAAGILSGHRATSHWVTVDLLSKWNALPTRERIVEDGKIITAAGVSAGIDMALYLTAKIAGEPVAHSLQLGIEYDPDPPFDVGSPDKADPILREALRKRLLARFTY